MSDNSINKGISCNVSGCVYNEKGCNCNLERVSISKGNGSHHFCKSYISLNDEVDEPRKYNIESANDEFFGLDDLQD